MIRHTAPQKRNPAKIYMRRDALPNLLQLLQTAFD